MFCCLTYFCVPIASLGEQRHKAQLKENVQQAVIIIPSFMPILTYLRSYYLCLIFINLRNSVVFCSIRFCTAEEISIWT
jgi:hypothetical protein